MSHAVPKKGSFTETTAAADDGIFVKLIMVDGKGDRVEVQKFKFWYTGGSGEIRSRYNALGWKDQDVRTEWTDKDGDQVLIIDL